MKKLLNIAIIVLVSYAVTLFALNTPAYWHNVSTWFGNNLGSISLTDITTGTQISAYPAIQTANNTLLETEINNLTASTTDTSLTTAVNLTSVGALSSGSLASGFTAVTVPIGGTGATTLTSGGALYGNGTGTIQATAACSDGEVISWTSGVPGCGSVSVNQTLAYDWTNLHTFTNASSTLYSAYKAYFGGTATSTFNTNGSLTLGGNFTLPTVDGVASTSAMLTDSSGNVTWAPVVTGSLTIAGAEGVTSNTSSTTLSTIVIPANTLSADTIVEIKTVSSQNLANSCGQAIYFGNGSASTTISAGTDQASLEATIVATSSSAQRIYGKAYGVPPTDTYNSFWAGSAYNLAATTYIQFESKLAGAGSSCGYSGYLVEILRD